MRILSGLGLLLICLGVLPSWGMALAQAGSTGGTIGRTDKSVSGGGEQRLNRRHSKPEKKDARCS